MTKNLTYPVELVKELNARHADLLKVISDPSGLSEEELLEVIEEDVLKLLARIGHIVSA